MREIFGLLFLLAACALTWGQVAMLGSASRPPADVIGIMIALTLVAYLFAYVATGDRVNKLIKHVLTFIGGGQCLLLLLVMALSITGYALQIDTKGPGYIILFLDLIAFGIYAAVLGGFLQQD